MPTLLNEVHRFIEGHGLRFVLLGSSARKLKHTSTNLLAGRALRRIMFPFLPEELGEDFALDEVLRFGSLPIIWQADTKQEVLDAYVQMYLKQEIQAEALVRNLPGFSRFLPVAALYHGQVLNVAGLARDAGVARSTVTGYLDILAAIEVKAKETLSGRDFKGLQTIAELEAVRRRIVVFLGERPFKTEDGIEALPVRDFLGEIEAGRI